MRKRNKQFIMPTHTLKLEYDIYSVWSNNVYIFRKNNPLTLTKDKIYIPVERMSFGTISSRNKFLSKSKNITLIFQDSKVPKIKFKSSVDFVHPFNFELKYAVGIEHINNFNIIYINLIIPEIEEELLKFTMDEIYKQGLVKLNN